MAATGTSTAISRASVEIFGRMPSGQLVHRVCLQSQLGDRVSGAAIITRGATIQEVKVPDAAGAVQDVALGFDSLDGYTGSTNFCYGGTPGRYANRIKGGSFSLEGQEFKLVANWAGASGKLHTLHGGANGFDGKVWDISKGPWVDGDGAHVRMSYASAAGEEGFPGNVQTHVTFSWKANTADDHALNIKWEATTDRTTVVNLTNHSYFNLCGVEKASQVLDTHTVTLNCDKWTEVDEDAIPTGKLNDVTGTCMDFRQPKLAGAQIADAQGGGYDHNFVVNRTAETPQGLQQFVGRVECTSSRTLECWATQPGVQFFTMQPASVFDKATTGKFGQVYPVHGGLCLETQHFPDSPNQPAFPSTAITPASPYCETCSYRFGVKR